MDTIFSKERHRTLFSDGHRLLSVLNKSIRGYLSSDLLKYNFHRQAKPQRLPKRRPSISTSGGPCSVNPLKGNCTRQENASISFRA
jgi:hypothetical protein